MPEAVDVTARWDIRGEITPLSFTWQSRAYPVVSVGRRWRDETGQHILCMAPGEQIFELIFQAAQERWLMILHPAHPTLA